MPTGGRNGSGTFSLPEAAFVSGTTISSDSVNNDFSSIATALTGSVASDGQTPNIGPLKGTSGTPGLPTYSFQNDSASGFYLVGTGQIGLALSGVNIATFGPSSFTYGGQTFSSVPSGVISAFAGSSAPSGWLLCFGQAVTRTGTNANLFAAIGTAYGIGDGTTTFNLPDMRGRLAAGLDDMGGVAATRLTGATITGGATTAGNSGGEQTHVLVVDELAVHTHADSGHVHGNTLGLVAGGGQLSGGGSLSGGSPDTEIGNAVLSNTGLGTAHNNVQPTIVMNYIIKQ